MHAQVSNGRSPSQTEDETAGQRKLTVGRELELALMDAYLEKVAASIIGELDAAGIGSILMKGAAFARLLYDFEGERPYGDIDLLVSPRNWDTAADLLRSHGFIRVDRDADWLSPAPMYAHTFRRPADGAIVDLHWTIGETRVSPEEVWSVLSGHTMKLQIGSRLVTVLGAPTAALVLALHGAHHGSEHSLVSTDLDRAVSRLEFGAWREAKGLAERLDARETFAAGLRLTAAGDECANRLGLDRPLSIEMWLKTNPRSHGAWVVDCFTRTRTLRGRLGVCLKVLAPPPNVLRQFFPLARRGPRGLAAAYLLRPLHLVMQAPSALREWRRARQHLKQGNELRPGDG